MAFSFETPLILRLRTASRHPILLLAAIFSLLFGVEAALVSFWQDYQWIFLIVAAVGIAFGLIFLLPYLLAGNSTKPLPGAGYGIAGWLSLLLTLGFAALTVLEWNGISLALILVAILPFLVFLGMTVAWFALRDTARNNRPHILLPLIAGLLACLVTGFDLGLAADQWISDLDFAAYTLFDYGILSLFVFGGVAVLFGGIALMLLGLSQKEKKQ